MAKTSILLVDDEEHIVFMLQELLGEEKYNIDTANNGEDALNKILKKKYSLVITDVKMPKMDGLTLLKKIKEISEDTYVLIITGYGNVDMAVRAMKYKAYDFITKPFSLKSLAILINKIIENEELKQLRVLKFTNSKAKYSIANVIGITKQKQPLNKIIKEILEKQPVDRLAITGPSGSGKSFLARVIHYTTATYQDNFFEIDCSEFSDQLLYSELFGQIESRENKIIENKTGLLEVLQGGTIHIKNIDQMPTNIQVKLLRAIKDNEIIPLGAYNPIPVNFKIIVSANSSLKQHIKNSQLREDLYLEIGSNYIKLPTLANHKEYLLQTINTFMEVTASKYKTNKKKLDSEAEHILFQHDWPGNKREIKYICEKIILKSKSDIITKEDLPETLLNKENSQSEIFTLDEMEKQCIIRALKYTSGNKSSTAALLGIHRKQLYRKIKKYEIAI